MTHRALRPSSPCSLRAFRLGNLSALLALAALALPAAAAADLLDWQTKVDAAVLEKAALGETEFLVYLAEQADLSGAYELATKEEKGRHVYDRLTAVAESSQAALLAELDLLGVDHRAFWIVNVVWARGDLAVVEAVARRPEVARVYAVGFGGLDAPVGTTATEEAASDPAEWNVELVGAPEVWAMGYTGQGVVVAGADTGVFWQHEALKDQYRGWDGSSADHAYNWHDAIHTPNAACPGSSPEPCDDDALLGGGHGTHTMGTIAGDGGPGNRIGVAPGASWIACRNMHHGLGAVPTYLECMEWFIAPTDAAGQNPDPARAPHVINNSWGCVEACPPPVLKAQLEASRAAGIVYVVSAGNNGPDCSTLVFPLAIYEGAFSVGATDRNDRVAGFSSRGPVLADVPNPPRVGPDISAPGVGVRSALRNGGYGSLSGTSMAGPHVAGLVALLISADPSLAGDVERIEQIVMDRARQLTSSQGCGDDTSESVPNNSYGWGRIDAVAAVLEALGENRPPTAVDDAAATDFGVAVTVDVLANDSDPNRDPLTVTAVTSGSAGGSVSTDGVTVHYRPPPGFLGTETFGYTVGDGRGGSATATVAVEVRCPAETAVTFADDLEPAPAAGWSTQTAANANPASLPWTAAPDAFASSPTTSFTSDATTLDLKDDRLVSPPLTLSAASRLVFRHRYDFEGGFDGGVLEVSLDGGATWADVVVAGGAFLQGGYDGPISPDFGSPIAGRAAWTGSSASATAMGRVEVDLGAFAGDGVLVRWRLTADPLAVGSLPGLGWWLDDVTVVERVESCPHPPVAVDDAANTARDTAVAVAVLANDFDPDGDPLTVDSVTDPANGSAAVEPDQSVTYTPDAGFTGTDLFEYRVCDPTALCATATVTVTVEDEAASPGRVSGSGSFDAGASGIARFQLDARSDGAGAGGRLSYRTDSIRLKGTVTSVAFPSAGEARVRGTCELADGTPCSFELSATDGGEPGAGRDAVSIRVTGAGGAVLHEAAGPLETGNVRVR